MQEQFSIANEIKNQVNNFRPEGKYIVNLQLSDYCF
jgi:hypothetical protein